MKKMRIAAMMAAAMMFAGMSSCGRYDDGPEFSDTGLIDNGDADGTTKAANSGEKLDWSATRPQAPNNNGGNPNNNGNPNPNQNRNNPNPNQNQNNNPNQNNNQNNNRNNNGNNNYNNNYNNNNSNNRSNSNYNYSSGGGNSNSGGWSSPSNFINTIFNNSRNNPANMVPGDVPMTTIAGDNSGATAPSVTIAAVPESTVPATTEAPEPEDNTIKAEITLGETPAVTGENVTVSGSSVYITAGGNYHITGSVPNGQIYIETTLEEKVKLILDGVDITCQSGPAILVEEAKRCTIELADGTVNRLSDGGADKMNNGVIFSNDTLNIKGLGTLEINSSNAHGIASDDDVIIESGTYTINAVKTGIYAHDDVTIAGGNLSITGGTNGIKSRGSVNIKSGRTVVSGGLKGEKCAIFAGTELNYSGGELFAAGRKVTEPTTSSAPYILVKVPAELGTADSDVEFVLNGAVRATMRPGKDFRYMLMIAADINDGATFNSYINGGEIGEQTISGMRNVFVIE